MLIPSSSARVKLLDTIVLTPPTPVYGTGPMVSVTAATCGVIGSAGNVGKVLGGLSATAASRYVTTSLAKEAAAVPAALLPFAALFIVVAAFAAAAALWYTTSYST